jgi:hypothetical protein
MRRIVGLVLYLGCALGLSAQEADWRLLLQAQFHEQGCGGSTDTEGNVISTGTFHLGVDFDPSGETFEFVGCNYPTYVAKYTPQREFIWALYFGAAEAVEPVDVEVDEANNIYVLGTYEGAHDFDPDPTSSFWMHPPSNKSFYLSKFNEDGEFQWMRSIDTLSDPLATAEAIDMVITSQGHPIVMLYMRGYVDLDLSPGLGDTVFTEGYEDPINLGVSLVEYDENGNALWAKGSDGTYCTELEIFDDKLYVLGQAELNGDIAFGNDSHVLSSTQILDYTAKLDEDGDVEWSVPYQNTNVSNNLNLRKIAIDENGKMIVAGDFRLTQDLDPTPSVENYTSQGWEDWFLAEYDTSGQYVQTFVRGDFQTNWLEGIQFDRFNNLWVYGVTPNQLDFDLLNNTGETAQGLGFSFLAKYDPSWQLDWVQRIGKTSVSNSISFEMNDMHADRFGSVYLTGYGEQGFHLPTEIDPSNYVNAAGWDDMYLVKYSPPCDDITDTIVTELCYGDTLYVDGDTFFATGIFEVNYVTHFSCDSTIHYEVLIGDSLYSGSELLLCPGADTVFYGDTITISGTYQTTLTSSTGCDSTVSLFVEQSDLFVDVTFNDTVFEAAHNGTSIQWYTCIEDSITGEDTLIAIAGADSAVFQPTEDGFYTAIARKEGCGVVDACIYYGLVGREDGIFNNYRIFPNPTTGVLNVHSDEPIQWQLNTIDGKEIIRGAPHSIKDKVDLSTMPRGVYILHVQGVQGKTVHRVIKQ